MTVLASPQSAARDDDLGAMFAPRAIAVVGASEKPGSVGRDVIENLIERGYDGTIYPVNPKGGSILGLPAYVSIADLPGPVDLAAIAIPAAAAPAAVAEAGQAGIPFAVVYASGFAETGTEGAALQIKLTDVAKAGGLRVLGPNCQGLMNIADGLHVGFGPPYKLDYRPGQIGLVSQSGAFGNSLLMGLSEEGVGLRHYASTGNEADIDALDLIETMLRDPGTIAVGAYVEGLRDPIRLRAVADIARECGTPIVMWKVGRSPAGAQAAASHTASLAGDDRLYRTAFRQFGIAEADDIADMADALRALETGRSARGNRVGIVTVSGGAGVAMADRAEALGLDLAQFAPETLASLQDLLPKFAGIGNPLDVTAGAVMDPAALTEVLSRVAQDPAVDMLALTFAGASGAAGTAIATAVVDLSAHSDLPIVVSWNAPRSRNADAYARLEEAGIPLYRTPARAMHGLGALRQARSPARPAAPDNIEAVAAPSRQLDEAAAKTHLAGTAVRAPREVVARSRVEAVEAFQSMGGPVVAKLLSSELAHKSDLGGVRLGLTAAADVESAFDALAAIPGALTPALPFEGVLIQEQIAGGVETILGVRIDPAFGPVVLFGAGGIFAEIFEDTALRLAPVSLAEAHEMITETRIAKLLGGARGRVPADTDALAQAIVDLSARVLGAKGEIQEIEINPLFVMPREQGVIAGDCVVRIRDDGARENGPIQ